MLNSTVSSWRQGKNHCGGGGYSSIPGSSSQTTGIRKHWRTIGLGARSILCIDAEGHIDADCHTITGANVPCPRAGGGTLPARAPSNDDTQTTLHREEEEANASKETGMAWFEKTARRLKRLHSEPGAAGSRWRLKKRGTCSDLRGQGSQSYDEDLHHHMARLHLITTTTTGKRIQHTTPSTSGASGDRTDALMGANPREEEPRADAQASSSPQREQGGARNEKGADAWEAVKRRVLYAEEHGNDPPLDMGDGHDAERALRELRARIRQGWAEEVMRHERKRSTKKRRRDAGCWIRENGVLLRCTVTVSVSSCM